VPRAFTSEETTAIRSRLKAVAAEAFARQGVRRTTVEELARAASISKGAFYGFYDSKEALFLALLEDYELAAHDEVQRAVSADPASVVDVLVDAALDALRIHPFLAVLMSQDALRVMQTATTEQRQALLDRDVRMAERVAERLHEAGLVLDVPQGVLLGLLRSLVFVGLHRPEIGDPLVEEMRAWLKRSLRGALHPTTSGRAT
jgi:AcrR family transcriptional regulator